MARDAFLLRIDPQVLEAVRRWADDDLRSVNGQIEFLLREALRRASRLPSRSPSPTDATELPSSPPDNASG